MGKSEISIVKYSNWQKQLSIGFQIHIHKGENSFLNVKYYALLKMSYILSTFQ